jgi:hypothetical protein
MAVYKLFPTQDATLYSAYPTMNTGLDAILEVYNQININGTPDVARYLIQFDSNEIADIINNKINGKNWESYLKNFIAEAQGINLNVSLEIRPTAQSWNNGTGYALDNPIVEDGASWTYSAYSGSNAWNMGGTTGGFLYTGSFNSSFSSQGGGNWFTTSSFLVTESFGLRDTKDIETKVTKTVTAWYSSSIPNNGFLIKLSSSSEFINNEDLQPIFKYYSVDTNTIYPPCLEFRWRDYNFNTGSSTNTILDTPQATISLSENSGIFYPESINKFRINARPTYPARVFQTASLYSRDYYLPTESYYAIKDLDTNEYIIDFDDQYTQLSADDKSSYFTLYMNGLQPERYYQVLIKSTINGSTVVFEDNNYFKVVR